MPQNVMSLKEYARHRGVSPKAVRLALQAGRITAERDGANWKINAAQADAQWRANTSPAKAKGLATSRPDAQAVAEAEARAIIEAEGLPPEALSEGGEGEEVNEDNSRKLYFIGLAREKLRKAQLLAIELKAQEGKLLPADKVKSDTFNIMRQVRDSLLNVPDRIAADLAAESDAFEVHRKLTAEIRTALATLAEVIRAQADGAPTPSDKSIQKD